jgi:hypothetical protein
VVANWGCSVYFTPYMYFVPLQQACDAYICVGYASMALE